MHIIDKLLTVSSPGADSSDSEGEDGQGAQEINLAMENCHLQMIYPLKMVIVHSYVKLPEGTYQHHHCVIELQHNDHYIGEYYEGIRRWVQALQFDLTGCIILLSWPIKCFKAWISPLMFKRYRLRKEKCWPMLLLNLQFVNSQRNGNPVLIHGLIYEADGNRFPGLPRCRKCQESSLGAEWNSRTPGNIKSMYRACIEHVVCV